MSPQLFRFFNRIDRYISGTGNHNRLSGKVHAVALHQFLCQIEKTITGGFRPDQRPSIGKALSGQHAVIRIPDPLVLTVEIADFSATDTDVSRRHIRIGTDMANQFHHKALAKTHDFLIALSVRIEIGTALAAADRKPGQRILEDLLQTQEFDDAEIDRGMKAKSSLIGSDRRTVLHTVSVVHMDLSVIIYPRYAELDDSLRC